MLGRLCTLLLLLLPLQPVLMIPRIGARSTQLIASFVHLHLTMYADFCRPARLLNACWIYYRSAILYSSPRRNAPRHAHRRLSQPRRRWKVPALRCRQWPDVYRRWTPLAATLRIFILPRMAFLYELRIDVFYCGATCIVSKQIIIALPAFPHNMKRLQSTTPLPCCCCCGNERVIVAHQWCKLAIISIRWKKTRMNAKNDCTVMQRLHDTARRIRTSEHCHRVNALCTGPVSDPIH